MAHAALGADKDAKKAPCLQFQLMLSTTSFGIDSGSKAKVVMDWDDSFRATAQEGLLQIENFPFQLIFEVNVLQRVFISAQSLEPEPVQGIEESKLPKLA